MELSALCIGYEKINYYILKWISFFYTILKACEALILAGALCVNKQLHIQLSAAINDQMLYCIMYSPAENVAEHKSEFVLTKGTPYLVFTGELWVSVVFGRALAGL